MRFSNGDVHKKIQQQGVARTMQRNIFEFCQENDLSKISVLALDLGAYAWARVGFVPKLIDWYAARKKLDVRFEDLRRQTPLSAKPSLSSCFNRISKAIKSKNPKSIWDIVDENEPFYFNPKISWGKALMLPNRILPLYMQVAATNISYSGSLDLKDNDCINRIENYVYGKNQTKTKAKIHQIGN